MRCIQNVFILFSSQLILRNSKLTEVFPITKERYLGQNNETFLKLEISQVQLAQCSSLYDPNNFDCAAAWKLYLCLQNSSATLNGPSASTFFTVGALWN